VISANHDLSQQKKMQLMIFLLYYIICRYK